MLYFVLIAKDKGPISGSKCIKHFLLLFLPLFALYPTEWMSFI